MKLQDFFLDIAYHILPELTGFRAYRIHSFANRIHSFFMPDFLISLHTGFTPFSAYRICKNMSIPYLDSLPDLQGCFWFLKEKQGTYRIFNTLTGFTKKLCFSLLFSAPFQLISSTFLMIRISFSALIFKD